MKTYLSGDSLAKQNSRFVWQKTEKLKRGTEFQSEFGEQN